MNSCPQSDRGEFGVSIELEPGASIEQNNQTTLRIERIFAQMPEIEKVFTGVGSQAMGSLSLSSDNLTQLNVTLICRRRMRKKTTTEVGEEIKSKLKEIPGRQGVCESDRYFWFSESSIDTNCSQRHRFRALSPEPRIRLRMF